MSFHKTGISNKPRGLPAAAGMATLHDDHFMGIPGSQSLGEDKT